MATSSIAWLILELQRLAREVAAGGRGGPLPLPDDLAHLCAAYRAGLARTCTETVVLLRASVAAHRSGVA